MQGTASQGMDVALSSDAGDGCPHINRNDPRCGAGFRLTGLDHTFAVCLGSYNGCPMYHRLNSELKRGARSGPIPAAALSRDRFVMLTAHGHSSRL